MGKNFGLPAYLVKSSSYELENHFYTKVLNAQLHPLVNYFFNISNERIINRYCHLNPKVSAEYLKEILNYKPKYLYWAGADLFHVTTAEGDRRMLVVETNSSPSGQKSMPLLQEHEEMGGYKLLLERTFIPLLKKKKLPMGAIAVMYDKNYMEASGYAFVLEELLKEPVYLVSFYDNDPNPSVRFKEGIMEVRDEEGMWHPIRAAYRYVTQRPWNRIPIESKTFIFNPIVGCLAGGRNKLVAAKAYELFNNELKENGLKITTPETILDVNFDEIPLWVQKFGGHAVIKNPYGNAGQGVYTITNEIELEEFMCTKQRYNQFIIQSLIGNFNWSTSGSEGKFYHVGTVPSKKNKIYVSDLRMMICSGEEGYRPVALYARRGREHLESIIDSSHKSWDMLGTNLSILKEDGSWDSDVVRLKLMDRKDFNTLGLGLDNLIDGYIQAVLASVAIDKMARNLINTKGKFKRELFVSLNGDEKLLSEIKIK
ncbi:hypothetical protein [Clostridium grantii]|uniref:Uncharacterized protein n=1 Tax=Clostridium grantii DSM 8605 TaxID=1121316 RepID=A0A1M5UQ45_9CLOT|nr:hypothetical protein [Clostridium grantii]SHH65145.1 hypothetical protein SAMN02745207_01881 [Clostridium grantii DSM 8605]